MHGDLIRPAGAGPVSPAARQRAGRAAAVAALVAAVVLGHLWLLQAARSKEPGAAVARSSSATSVQLRSLTSPSSPSPSPAVVPAATPAGPTPGHASHRPPHARAGGVAAARPTAAPRALQPMPAPERAALRDAGSRDAESRDAVFVAAGDSAERAAPPAALLPTPPASPGANEEAPPVYPTQLPAPARLQYVLLRGAAEGSVRLDWQTGAEGYELTLHGTLPGGAPLEQRSVGGFDGAGLAPLRLVDRRRGRGAQAANFEREHGRVRFSGARAEVPLQAGAQDRLSWMAQLSAIAAAGALDGNPDGAGEIVLQVVGARGASARWRFVAASGETLAGPSGETRTVRLVREPQHLYDLRIEVWLAPSRGWWPLRLRQTQVPGGEPTEWRLMDEPSAPAGT